MAKKKRKSRKTSSGLSSSQIHHESEAAKFSARATSMSCGAKGLTALLSAQTAFVHALESGNQSLIERTEKHRDKMVNRMQKCCAV